MTDDVQPEHRLTLPEVIDALVADGLVDAGEGARFKQERRYHKGDTHPLVVIAEQHWKSLQPPNRMLDLESLTQWLAKWCGLPYMHVDPLKINFAAVTEVMSISYATRFRILPVEVRANEVVIATAEPYQRAWEAEMLPILRKDIARVISNPEDIARFQVEFYNLAKSVKSALAKGDIAGVPRISSSWSRWGAPTSSSTPTTTTSSPSSTGSGSTPSSSAPRTSTSSRGARSASCASASTGCCTRCTRSR